MKGIVVASLNCRGLSEANILQLKDLVVKFDTKILLLQETRSNKASDVEMISSNFDRFHVKVVMNETKSKGVGFIISREFQISNFTFCENRLATLDVVLNGRSVKFVNIYAPNTTNEQVEFIENLYNLEIKNNQNVIVAGDFNCTFDSSNLTRGKINQKEWCSFFKLYDMSEVKNTSDLDYTWTNGTHRSYIDKFFCKSLYKFFVFTYHENYKHSMSDHNLVMISLSPSEKRQHKSKYVKANEWKLNERVLDDEYVNNYIINKSKFIPEMITKHGKEWYEYFINDIIKMLKRESRRLHHERSAHISSLFSELNLCQVGDGSEKRQAKIKYDINNYYKSVRIGCEKRACEIKRNFMYQPSKLLIEKEINKAKKCEIKKFECKNKKITEENDEIMTDVFDFYKDLMSKDRVSKEQIENYSFNIKPLDDENKKIFMDFLITYEEAHEVVQNMKGAAPGPNGLTIGFYKRYFVYFGKYFVDLINRFDQTLSDTFNKVHIKLIPKNSKVTKNINDLRPLSLSNYEYRIFTKILVNRLYRVSNVLIGDHQTCGIIGRRMNDNICMMRDLIADAKVREKVLNIISVDQRKAFDSISHNYMFAILEHINIGTFMLENIKRLYRQSYAHIILNQLISKEINIKSGIKQGCALSMMLYIIAIEELLIRVKNNVKIKGYDIQSLVRVEIKVSAYADDVTGYTVDERSTKDFFQEFDEWGKMSGASINKEKTQILHVKKNERESEDVKILGVLFNNNGISQNNLNIVKNKITQSMYMWNTVKLNIIERIVVCKTFLLSKLWFMLNFVVLSKDHIKEINKMIFRFVWNSPIELVKRNTLILPYNEGGLSMFNIEAKIETIFLQNFLYLSKNCNRDCYRLSVYWMKFELRDMKLHNFNIIPSGDERNRPSFYQKMTSCVRGFKKHDKELIKNAHKYSSKKTYEIYRKKYEEKPTCQVESSNTLLDWKSVYERINNKKFCSEIRSFNYKLLNNGISPDTKISKMYKKCHLCGNDNESRDHLFLDCSVTKKLFEKIKNKMKSNFTSLNREKCIMFTELDYEDSFIMSIFNMSIWRLRNILMGRAVRSIEGCFLGVFKFFSLKYR